LKNDEFKIAKVILIKHITPPTGLRRTATAGSLILECSGRTLKVLI
jgi:hypothetical protein